MKEPRYYFSHDTLWDGDPEALEPSWPILIVRIILTVVGVIALAHWWPAR